MSIRYLRSCAAEFIGTFILVFAGTAAIVVNATAGQVTHVGIALTFGLVVLALIYALGDVSGAHFNPAVTLGFAVARRFPFRCVPLYVFSQLTGATAASITVLAILGDAAHLGATSPAGSPGQSFWLELLLTAFLMFVILCVSTGPKEIGVMAGIAVGAVIALEALLAGPISGASMNPARSLGPAVVSGQLAHLWLYLAAPPVGAALAVPCWLIAHHARAAPASPASKNALQGAHV